MLCSGDLRTADHTSSSGLSTQRRQFIDDEVPRRVQIRRAIHNSPLLASTRSASPLRPCLQVAEFIHTAASNREHQCFRVALSSLPKRGFDTAGDGTLVVSRLASWWYSTTGVGRPGVEVEPGFYLVQCT